MSVQSMDYRIWLLYLSLDHIPDEFNLNHLIKTYLLQLNLTIIHLYVSLPNFNFHKLYLPKFRASCSLIYKYIQAIITSFIYSMFQIIKCTKILGWKFGSKYIKFNWNQFSSLRDGTCRQAYLINMRNITHFPKE